MVRKRSGLSLKVQIFTITAAWTQWSGMQNSVLVPLGTCSENPPWWIDDLSDNPKFTTCGLTSAVCKRLSANVQKEMTLSCFTGNSHEKEKLVRGTRSSYDQHTSAYILWTTCSLLGNANLLNLTLPVHNPSKKYFLQFLQTLLSLKWNSPPNKLGFVKCQLSNHRS